jgi:hypothetical protein
MANAINFYPESRSGNRKRLSVAGAKFAGAIPALAALF